MRKLSFPALLAGAVMLPLLQSCFISRHSRNEPLSPAAVASLTPGKSTAKECVAVLGAPTDVVQLGKRFAYRYDHSIEKGFGLFLVVFLLFNEDARQVAGTLRLRR